MAERRCHIREDREERIPARGGRRGGWRVIERMRCGRSLKATRSYAWESAVPYYPRADWCELCLRAYEAAGSPAGVVGSKQGRPQYLDALEHLISVVSALGRGMRPAS